jgi:outer membrane protein
MNRYVALGCLGLGLLVSPVLGGISKSAVPPVSKIGVINMEEILLKTPAAKRAGEAFEKQLKTKQSVLDKQQEEFKRATADLEKQKSLLKPETYDSRRQELEKKMVELQQTYVKLERELQQDKEKVTQELLKQAEPKVAAIAKAEGLTMIVERSATLYFDPALDVTAKLVAEMK